MKIKRNALFIVLGVLLNFSMGYTQNNDNPEQNKTKQCECSNGRKSCKHHPLCRYYRYCTLFQKSYVREDFGDDPASSWPSRRDGNFSDELTR